MTLIYKSLIDCVLDDEQLIPPDFDLSFEQEYQELIDRSEKLEETIGEDRETLLEEINKLRENRDEFTKFFHLDDGSNIAVNYEFPVFY